MNFEKAYIALLDGKKIRRREWGKLMYIQLKDGNVTAYQGENTSYYRDSNILVSDNWRVVGEEDKQYSFIEVIECLRNRKSITNEKMGEAFIFIDNDEFVLCRPVEFNFMPTWKCLNSNDWEIAK